MTNIVINELFLFQTKLNFSLKGVSAMPYKDDIQKIKTFVITKRVHHPHLFFRSSFISPMYFVTFDIENGKQLELEVPSNYFTFFIEGDEGILYYQNRSFLSFERTNRL